ncbi:MAG: LysE family translocator [Lautropia sp.]|nr:LysE family translocator [Lautropia sp.]
MDAAELGALVVMGFVSSFTPGPNNALATAIGANQGLRPAWPFVWAVPVGWCTLFLLSAMGLGALVMAVPVLRWALLVLGVGYMLWLALKLAGSQSLSEGGSGQAAIGFWQGVLLQAVNIKAWMIAMSVVAGWVAGQPDVVSRTLLVLGVMFVMGWTSCLTYAMVGSLLREWLSVGQRLIWFNRLMALGLVLTALWMLWREI